MNVPLEEVHLLNQKAANSISVNDFSTAESLLSNLLLSFPQSSPVSLQEVITLNNYSILCEKQNNCLKSLSLLLKANQFSPSSSSEYSLKVATLLNLSSINFKLRNFKLSIKNASEAINLAKFHDQPEIKASAYFNLGSILAHIQKFEKAKFYFSQASEICVSFLGQSHELTLLASENSKLCRSLNSNRSKNPSYSSKKSKLSKHFEETDFKTESKVTYSTRFPYLSKSKRPIAGLPYIKELRYARNSKNIFSSPSRYHSDVLTLTRNTGLNVTLYDREESLDIKLKKIKNDIKQLEGKLEEFIINTKTTQKIFGELGEDDLKIREIVRIQKWFRKVNIKHV